MATKPEGTARERLLAAANQLFYEEGVHTVGIDRVIERAGVAKASLYAVFGSKEELIQAYLQMRADTRKRRISERIAQYDRPRDRILAVFDVLAEAVARPTFRGCAFINAAAEGPPGETKASQIWGDSRLWLRSLFTELARDLEVADPERLAARLVLLYDGVLVGANMDRNPTVAMEAKATAELLLDAETKAKTRRRRRRSRR